jgi:cobyrinic acid a,c-diamide synthase
MHLSTPRLIVAGLAGDSGKTLVALGLARALARRGRAVAPFKKGPDYIDAAWLGAAVGGVGRNLDTFFMPPEAIGEALRRGTGADLMLVEGNRGLHDGFDTSGSHSTAELAKLLRAPVILVVDVTKMTRTAAALVIGCQALDPRVTVAGVVLNRVATARQERVIRGALEEISAPPVLGALPRLQGDPLPGRHLGLVTAAEHPRREEALDRAAEAVEAHLDLDALLEVAATAPPLEFPDRAPVAPGSRVRVGVFRDAAFSFYYPENLEALEEAGAELVAISPLSDRSLPAVDALYLGGGFPEVHAERLAGNRPIRDAVRSAVQRGVPVYAECGGLMYLARELVVEGTTFPMAGALDLVLTQTPRPQGHGYVVARVDRPNPFFAEDACLRGHEFHYSRVDGGDDRTRTVLQLERGQGVENGRDGVVTGRVFASYLHLHALGTPAWAPSLLAQARTYQRERLAATAVPAPDGVRAGGSIA